MERNGGDRDEVDAGGCPPSGCTASEQRAWAGLVRAHTQLTRLLDARLQADEGRSSTQYDVVHAVSTAGGSVRISRLADLVALSPSRVSRVVDQLAADGLLERRACASDGRVTYAGLTSAGAAWLARASTSWTDQLREQFLDKLNPEQVRVLGEVWQALDVDAPRGDMSLPTSEPAARPPGVPAR